MNLATMVKMARGAFSIEEVIELVRGFGLELEYRELMNG
jgi:hypothetical protein